MLLYGLFLILVLFGEQVSAEGECELYLDDGSCVWAVYKFEKGITFAKAEKRCKKGSIARVVSEDDYNSIIELLRSQVPDWSSSTRTWIGNTVGAEDEFFKWNPNQGFAAVDGWNNVYIQVYNERDDEDEGMLNFFKDGKLDGVLCQRFP